MIKALLLSMIFTLSVISAAFAGDLTIEVNEAVSKSQGKCKVSSVENETITIYCVKSSDYSSFKITLENNLISGTGQTWSKNGDEAECVVAGKVKEDDKIKLSVRCLSIN